jgi:hypothetical protein
MSRTLTLAAAVLVTSTAVAAAHSVEARFEEENDTIEYGRQTGSITWLEGRKLRRELGEIARVKDRLEADGRLSSRDKRILYRMQDRADAHIEAEASDRWHRLWWLPRVGR